MGWTTILWFILSHSLSQIELIKGKVAESSYEAYDRQWRRLLSWLQDRGLPPRLSSLSVPLLLELFDDMFAAGFCYATPNLTRSAIALQCCLGLLPAPFITTHPAIIAALKGYKRRAAGRSVRREPIGKARYAKLLSLAKQLIPPALWAQVEAAFALGYEALFRIQETLTVLVADVSFTPEGVLIFLAQSKTDQFRKGIYIRVRERRLCTLLRQLYANRQPHHKLFSISAHLLNAVIKQAAAYWSWLGYFSYHSLRHGKATDIWLAMGSLEAVMKAGRWSSKASARWYVHVLDCPDLDGLE